MADAKACAAHMFNKHHAVGRALGIVTQYDKSVIVCKGRGKVPYHAHDIAAPLVRVHKGKLQPGVDTLGSRLHLQQTQHDIAVACLETARCI